VSDGPFLLERLALDRYASFVPNPVYGGRHPTYRRLVLAFGGDAPLHALQAGDLDAAHLPFPLVGLRAPGTRFRAVALPPTAGWRGIALNLRNERVGFLRDVRVRRALALAIDQATIVRTVFHGASQPVTGPLLPDPAARSPYDPRAAAALLEAAGWRAGQDGVRVRAGQRLALTIVLPAGGAEVEATLAIVAADLRAVGVEARLRTLDAQALFAMLDGPPAAWEAAVVATTLNPFPSDEQDVHADGFGPGRLRDPRLDAAVAASIEQPGEAGLAAFARAVAEDVPWLFLPEGNFTLWVDRRVRGVADFASALGYRSPEYLEVDAAGCRADEG
jgi:peptide/nickel transport system substrate-binding protein